MLDGTSASTSDLRDFSYDTQSTPSYPWRLAGETLTSFYGSRALSRLYDSTTAIDSTAHTATVAGRPRGFKLGAAVGSSSELEQTHTYTDSGRFHALASGHTANASTRTFRYAYLANSTLIESLAIDAGAGPAGTRSPSPANSTPTVTRSNPSRPSGAAARATPAPSMRISRTHWRSARASKQAERSKPRGSCLDR
ncbi:MAG: hypothetical protein HZA93_22090 [Verrucomicrobia bacterium]|nr:hypothetical protein [Verrucomicrobiota bacterium]